MGVGIIVVRKLTTGTEQFLLCGACIVTYSLTFPFYFISFLFFFLLSTISSCRVVVNSSEKIFVTFYTKVYHFQYFSRSKIVVQIRLALPVETILARLRILFSGEKFRERKRSITSNSDRAPVKNGNRCLIHLSQIAFLTPALRLIYRARYITRVGRESRRNK